MIIKSLFLKTKLFAIFSSFKPDWITNQKVNFNVLKESIVIQLDKMIDSGIINKGNQLTT